MADEDCERCVELRQEAIDSDASYWRVRRQLRDVLRMLDRSGFGLTVTHDESALLLRIRREIEVIHQFDADASEAT